MPKRTSAKNPEFDQYLEEFINQIRDMTAENRDEIMRVLNESEDNSLSLQFKFNLDRRESKPIVESQMHWSQHFRAKRTSQMDDPDQGVFTPIDDAAKKKRGKAVLETDVED